MKMTRTLYWSVLVFLFSIFLQGCDFGEGGEAPEEAEIEAPVKGGKKPKKGSIEDDLPAPPVVKKKAVGKCKGGHFHCDGGWREWCKRMKNQCKPKDCSPMCAWTCDSPKCSQECGPVCNQPICSTRCKGFNTDSCKMKCGKPNCKVVCPKHFCPGEDCAACKTECGKPQCAMECGKDDQPCRHVCAQPVCKWECKNPQLCPKPKCAMKCKKVPDCAAKSMHSTIPPMEPGETEIVTVDSGAAPAPAPGPALLMQRTSGSMRMNFTRMDNDGKLHNGQVDLAMVQVDAEDSMESSWTKMVTEVNGQVSESEASCTSGRFHCQGDTAWCAEQRELVCEGGQTTYLRQQKQSHLQA